ncbi:Iron transport multicopper oxidase FET3 [Tolypocladium capitatum]|uniref:Iron transport multicopper oxidase FET3 n=1 Tax=Tolypocladium capitatum TaxID=45235 RepID=A0A2K3Q793_9HYPO|nr:Iron transport multicopper oxidase FET3 [Tolypocladium capitatum]
MYSAGASGFVDGRRAREVDDEQQAFLEAGRDQDTGAAAALAPSRAPAQSRSWSRGGAKNRLQHRGCCKLSLFILLFAVTVLALAGVILGFPPNAEVPAGDDDNQTGHDHDHGQPDEGHHDGQEDEGHGHDVNPARVVHHHEDVPSVAHLRDTSEYVLSPSWDIHSPPTTHEYRWTILDADLNPDGVYRPMVLINNQFPGPLIECNDGDTLIVHVENRAVNATSIHFHGLFQNGTNFMDGAVGVTQCPIAPNSDFAYKFDVRGQSGTYWYHAHHSAQASDGLLGPVVIHSKDEHTLQELGYTTDRVVMVQDHYHNTTAELLMDYLQPDKENDEPVPDNALINGRGVRNCHDFPGRRCDSSNTSRPVFDLTAGERHRLRFVNVGAFAEFQIQIDEHPFYITEVDGTDVHPEPFHRLNILPAQRYSIVVETNATTAETFWLRARMVTHCFARTNKRPVAELRGIVRYVSSATKPLDADPQSKEWADAIEVICRDLNTTALHPVVHVTPPPADDFVALRANFMIGAWRLSRGFFNDSTWHANATHPSLHRFLDASADVKTLGEPFGINDRVFDRGTELVMQTTGIRTIDISINNFDDGAHPFHLHGHKFFVLAQARDGYPPRADQFAAYVEANGGLPENPLRRDTVTVEGYAWVIIRVVLDNPGFWTLHCHNAWHAEAGMVMQLLVQGDVVKDWTVDPGQRAMCGLEGVSTGMRPDDGIWFGSF